VSELAILAWLLLAAEIEAIWIIEILRVVGVL
jgi:hypothetical protein